MPKTMYKEGRVRDLEHRAEELRTIAESMHDESCRQTFQQLAGEYEQMAAQRRQIAQMRSQMQ